MTETRRGTESNAFVSPWDVENGINPVMFPHLTSKVRYPGGKAWGKAYYSASVSQSLSPPPDSSQTYRVIDDGSDYWVDAYINGTRLRGLPDNGAALNIISENCVRQHNFQADCNMKSLLQLPDGSTVGTSGTLEVEFAFANHTDTSRVNFPVRFTVLAGCIHDFVLSGTFLQATKTFTTFKDRIHRSLPAVRPTVRVCFHGAPQQQVIGSINGHAVLANPDTGSEINVIRESSAIDMGLKISPDPENTTLEFINGSRVAAVGVIRDVEWKYGKASKKRKRSRATTCASEGGLKQWKFGADAVHGATFVCDFYVVKLLTVPVILSSTMLYGTNAFVACEEHIQNVSASPSQLQLDYPEVAVVKRARKSILGRMLKRGQVPVGKNVSSKCNLVIAKATQHRRQILPAPLHRRTTNCGDF